MKTVFFNFGGTPTPGDLVMVSYSAARGGRSTAKYRVSAGLDKPEAYIDGDGQPRIRQNFIQPDRLIDIVEKLANEINSATSEWCPGTGDFRAIPRGDSLMVMYSDQMADVRFAFDVEGPGCTETCAIEIV